MPGQRAVLFGRWAAALLLFLTAGFRAGYHRAEHAQPPADCCNPLSECETEKMMWQAKAEEAQQLAQDVVNCMRPCITMCGLETTSKKTLKSCAGTCLGHCEAQAGLKPTEVDLIDPRGRTVRVVHQQAILPPREG